MRVEPIELCDLQVGDIFYNLESINLGSDILGRCCMCLPDTRFKVVSINKKEILPGVPHVYSMEVIEEYGKQFSYINFGRIYRR